VNYVVTVIVGGSFLLALRLLKILRPEKSNPPPQAPTAMNDASTTNSNQESSPTSTNSSEQSTALSKADAQSEQPTENNPLKRFQDLVNSPETPDGHKVVAAVAAASTVTVAAVANWLMKATKK
jgi:cytoskeletal protein RodZ